MARTPPTWLVYTDGSCKAGGGAPGGWGFVLRPPGGAPIEGYGKATRTFAKVMEVRAVAEALEAVPEGSRVTVHADNQSLVENLTKRFRDWCATDFKNVDPLLTPDLRRIAATITTKSLDVRWQWIRGHNGNAGNERADALAVQGAREAKADLAAAR